MKVTIKDVARLAGVSRATVSRVLSGHPAVRPGTREKVMAVVRELGFRPSPVARGLATGTLDLIALNISDISNPIYAEMVRGVEAESYRAGFPVMLVHTEESAERERLFLLSARAYGFAGIILTSACLDADTLGELVGSLPCPTVLLNRTVVSLRCDRVVFDNVEGARLVTHHLLELGHRRIAHLTAPDHAPARERLQGYRLALEQWGLRPDPELVAVGPLTVTGGAVATRRLLAAGARFTAICAASDLMAVGCVQELLAHGIRVPDEVSVAGFDDSLASQIGPVPLTTVRQPQARMGEAAARMLVERIRGFHGPPRASVHAPELVVRQSTAPPPAGAQGLG